ncbi:MAG TPA: UDP-N-acetylmuramoyl-tripeptide--D-alanyl-D-alanine ligase [Bacteroidia bacterium]|nr:UDP-N-acetylmuramoyl-tripeptide--D-alanyl-D-alanine ligase [Bacteroidia bacterium]
MNIEELYQLFLKHPSVSTDSRTIKSGSIFFALRGENFDGNKFAKQAIEQGAAYSVIDNPAYEEDERFILVEDSMRALQQLATMHRSKLKIPVIAITGSNGKTTTKELTYAVLFKKFNAYATKRNLNNHIGVPLSLLEMNSETEIAVIEMGANHRGEIAALCEIANPDFGLITNVGKAHLEGFGGFEGVKKGKGELYSYLSNKNGTAFINAENFDLHSIAEAAGVKKIISYGTNSECDCNGKVAEEFPSLRISWKAKNKSVENIIQTHLTGSYNLENILAAVCIGNYFGVEPENINSAIAEYIPSNNRSQVVFKGSNMIILDCYNANPSSMTAALINFSGMKAKKKVVILGDMLELANESEALHRTVLEQLDSLSLDKIILIGKEFISASGKENIKCKIFATTEDAKIFLSENKFQDAAILVKGSHALRLEKLFDTL